MSDIHIIKLAVGIDDLQMFCDLQSREMFDYHGTPAVPCWTRFKPKRADEILQKGGSIYRVIKNRIQCRHKILGFEMVETSAGTKCMIVQDAQMIETIAMPRRAFQGWRYLKAGDAPDDRGVYTGKDAQESIPEDMEDELKDAGLL